MSWIIGLIGSPIRVDLKYELLHSHAASEMIAESENYVVIANTQSATCLYSRRDDFSNDFFVLVGSPVLKEDGKYCLVDERAFSSLLKEDVSTIHQHLAGQYSVVRSNGNRIELFSDPNTLRSLFVAEYDKQIVFSSHLHLISEIVQELTIDFRSFGSHWMAHNQLSEKSLVTGVSRICGSDLLSVETDTDRSVHGQPSRTLGAKKVTMESTHFGISKKDDPFRDILGFLGSYQGNLKLALSGGLDSRLLFALTQHKRGREFETFVFGEKTDPDVLIAQQISEHFNIPCNYIESLSMSQAVQSGILYRYATETFCTTPLSACMHSANYDRVFNNDIRSMVIDGAFGEIGRGQFYKKIEILRHLAFFKGISLTDYKKALSFRRADIFCKSIMESMDEGFSEDAENFVSFLLQSQRQRNEDVAAIKYRRRNFFGYDQAWIDQFGLNMMPFGQNPFVYAILNVPTRKRRGNSFYKQATKQYSPFCTTVPLAKGSRTYPYTLPHSFLPLIFAVQKKFRKYRSLPAPAQSPYLKLREFVFDIVRSRSTRTYGPYDIDKIDKLVTGFYDGRTELHWDIDWFLSFELWRRGNKLT